MKDFIEIPKEILEQLEQNKLYRCDPDKNNVCTKENCYKYGGPCNFTKNKEFARKMKFH